MQQSFNLKYLKVIARNITLALGPCLSHVLALPKAHCSHAVLLHSKGGSLGASVGPI